MVCIKTKWYVPGKLREPGTSHAIFDLFRHAIFDLFFHAIFHYQSSIPDLDFIEHSMDVDNPTASQASTSDPQNVLPCSAFEFVEHKSAPKNPNCEKDFKVDSLVACA
jgi:hypothetical protein